MDAFVPGGADFTGLNTVRRLLELDTELLELDNLSSSFLENLISDIPFVEANMEDGEAVSGAQEVAGRYILKYWNVGMHLP
jgi:UDP-glucose 4-epimerase